MAKSYYIGDPASDKCLEFHGPDDAGDYHFAMHLDMHAPGTWLTLKGLLTFRAVLDRVLLDAQPVVCTGCHETKGAFGCTIGPHRDILCYDCLERVMSSN